MAAGIPLPPFLRQSRAQLHAKFVDLEWQQRNRLLQGTQTPTNPADPPSPWFRLTGDEITARNRYLNVEPYANNRVKLDGEAGESGHEGPAVVVMLTQTHEAGREKCFQYYPLAAEESPLRIPEDEADEGGEGFGGEVDLASVEVDEQSRCEVRRLKLRMKKERGEVEEKEIRHLLFSGWPDFLIPEGEDRDALIKLVKLSDTLNTSTKPTTNGRTHAKDEAASNPRIIHCSAGVGRSGTFIALDYLLARLDAGTLDYMDAQQDPIAEAVDLLRQQRMMMVQGESQFNFLYEVLREKWEVRQGLVKG
ncbi:tyrosine protein phosphatase 1 [Elasticomyces elasticus]|nr:tyrosine protein phosphatase 1 [Elasticomyces elasticus]